VPVLVEVDPAGCRGPDDGASSQAGAPEPTAEEAGAARAARVRELRGGARWQVAALLLKDAALRRAAWASNLAGALAAPLAVVLVLVVQVDPRPPLLLPPPLPPPLSPRVGRGPDTRAECRL
jgi:hypothetical protein